MKAGNVMDDLLYLGLGAVVGELIDRLAVKYADSRAGMNIAMLGAKAGKPSVYIPGATGIAALGYAANQGNKFGRLKDEEMVIAGYGLYSLVKTAGKVLAPVTITPAAPSTSMRYYAPGGPLVTPMQNGLIRGSV